VHLFARRRQGTREHRRVSVFKLKTPPSITSKRYQAGGLKEIKTNSGRQRVNINGVVNAHDPTDVVIRRAPPLMLNRQLKSLMTLNFHTLGT
jgi:hypothetical protein